MNALKPILDNFFFIKQMKKIENIPGHQKQGSEMF